MNHVRVCKEGDKEGLGRWEGEMDEVCEDFTN